MVKYVIISFSIFLLTAGNAGIGYAQATVDQHVPTKKEIRKAHKKKDKEYSRINKMDKKENKMEKMEDKKGVPRQ
jgi:hypothetical protein